MRKHFIFVLLSCFISFFGISQSIEGFVLDENSNPIPYVKVWLKNYNNTGTTTDLYGHYEISLESPNTFEVIYSLPGYEKQTHTVTVSKFEPVKKDVYLKEENVSEFDLVEISSKKKNIGYSIVKHVMARKKELATPVDSYSYDIYVKGTETFDFKQKKEKEQGFEEEENNPMLEDSFEEEAKKEKKLLEKTRLNLVETSLTINFQAPNKLKEIKTAQSKIGYPQQIYLGRSPVFMDAYFNFYRNLVYKTRLHETPIVSPLSHSGILSYKYKLLEIIQEGNDTIYKVHIKPRSVGSSTLEGDLYIKKNEWVLTKVDLSMHKGNLKAYDNFHIIQEYKQLDSIWVVNKQTFIYDTKYGKETIKGKTEVLYSNYNLNPQFPENFFSNEVALTVDDAYEKDSSYWEKVRPIKLSTDEQRKKFVQDSIIAAHNKKEYLDSVDLAYNKITFYKVCIDGIGRRNREKKTQWYFPSIISLIEPIAIAGPRINPYLGYRKRFKSEKAMYLNASPSIGFLNKDLRGSLFGYLLYNPKKLAYVNASIRHDVALINNYVPYLDYIDPSNYFFSDGIAIYNGFEVFNGFYLNTGFNVQRRSSISNLEFYNWQGDALQTSDPIEFDPYNIVKTTVSISYTPAQKYLSEPKRKVILGSKFPTFTVTHNKGWKNILGSGVDFDKLTFTVNQKFRLKTWGESNYRAQIGKFVNQDSVYFIDQQFFRSVDIGLGALLMSNPLYSFQNLEQSYQTRDVYASFNYKHNFNGAIINKIPFMKKTRIRSVAGGGMLFVPQYNNLYYQEIYFGIQRQFKFLKERFKIGTFVIFSNSNAQVPKVQFKILFESVNLKDVTFDF